MYLPAPKNQIPICFSATSANTKCNNCCKSTVNDKYIYWCRLHDTTRYPNGYSFCYSCAKNPNNNNYTSFAIGHEQKENKVSHSNLKTDSNAIKGKTGWMYKKGYYNVQYKKRYFELNLGLKTLSYYVPSTSGKLKFTFKGKIDFRKTPIIKLSDSTSTVSPECKFVVATTERKWTFRCMSIRERDEWFDAISKVNEYEGLM